MMTGMCGRFVASAPVSELAEAFDVAEVLAELPDGSLPDGGAEEAGPPRWNIAPQAPVWAVTAKVPEEGDPWRRLRLYHWGLVPHWSKGPGSGSRAFNARSETLADNSMFATPLARRRCIVPADAFYEWTRSPGGGGRSVRKEPWCFEAADGSMLAFAGLWEYWRDRQAGAVGSEDAPMLRSCTIITTASTGVVASIHDRCPVVLPPEAWEEWLAPAPLASGILAELLAPADAGLLVGYPVARLVNDARQEGPELVAPLPEGGAPAADDGLQTLFELP
jgi:putative SOS response-associated peptidase YedK